ncbi:MULTISPECIES: YceI family protein [unclassified Brevundimonas]|uniref:YceI family protein n=1 Tax=unclassified Brevundimonas TaxID=2622653 RepID=UPI0025BB1FAD|nr:MULTISPECIES: YceI family protein [unclassified Brevundimonas]
MRTTFRKALIAASAVTLMATGAVVAQAAFTTNPAEVQAGDYQLDSSHGRITWKINHLGFSDYIGQFVNVKAELKLDPANPANSSLTAEIPIADIAPNDDALKRHLLNADFFDVENHPTATFRSTRIVVDADDPDEADVYGDLTIKGITKPVKLEVEFNQAGSMRGTYRAGFDAAAKIKRSDFGITYGLPMLGDEVELHIEGEFVK